MDIVHYFKILGGVGMDFKNMIGNLFFDRARSVPASKQLSEEVVNGMYGTHFQPDAYRVVTICAANLQAPDLQELDEWMQRCAQQLLPRLAPLCHDSLYHFDRLRIRLLLNYDREQDAQLLFLLRSYLSAIPPMENGSYPAVACCSRLHSHIQQVDRMITESSDIMWTRFLSRQPLLIHPDAEAFCPGEVQAVFTKTEAELKAACGLLDLPAFQKQLDAFFGLPDTMIARPETRRMLRNVESYMFEINRDLIASFTDGSKAQQNMMLSLRNATCLEAYKRQYTAYLCTLMQHIRNHTAVHLSRPIRQAQQYIQANYQRPLRLEEVAAHVGLVPVYLCARFKQEVGLGFTEYCNRCRIDRAKQLLKESQLPIVEIALQVGFSSPRYFGRVFKAAEGLQPNQFRLLHEK